MSSAAIRRLAGPAAQVNAQVNTAQVVVLASNPLVPATVPCPGKLSLEGKRFSVRAEGSAFTAVGTTTLKVSLLGNTAVIPATPLTASNWVTLYAGTAQAVPVAGCPWWIDAQLILDSNSGLCQGQASQDINNVWVAPAAIATALTGINGTNLPVVQAGPVTVQPQDPTIYFALAVTFSVAGANVANVANFEIAF